MTAMIKLRHQQPSLWHRGLAEDIEGLWEPWMLLVDKLLEDEQLLDTVYEAQGKRHLQIRIRGRMQTPAEVLLRLLLLKHIRNWSYDVLEREVRGPPVRFSQSRRGTGCRHVFLFQADAEFFCCRRGEHTAGNHQHHWRKDRSDEYRRGRAPVLCRRREIRFPRRTDLDSLHYLIEQLRAAAHPGLLDFALIGSPPSDARQLTQ
jgi:hypothetical protein